MFVKSIIIDGFKSYGNRTEINGFDPFFNAITGLNGSGKSNILDSICFLLGITNLSQVRATNLHELVYKNGQAGITKATVSITFDNKDKNGSPIGYEQYSEITVTRQVVVGGRNKYLINGVNAQNSRVQDLFHSVQLNVNNPHFLIMQGRITKVLNMKPPEILSMIEEAAGTKMYESKKQSAQKTIEKKDAKLREINSILNEEIAPTLNKLKEERASYLEYQKIQRELEHLTKLWVAYQYVYAEKECTESKQNVIDLEKAIETINQRTMEAKVEIEELGKNVKILEKKKNEEGGGKLDTLENGLKEKQALEAKTSSSLKNIEETIEAEKKKKVDLKKNIDEDNATLKNKEKELKQREESLKAIQDGSREDIERLSAAQKRFQAASAGLSANKDGEDATLADQLIVAKSEVANADTETKQARMKLTHAEKELEKKNKLLKTSQSDYTREKSAFDVGQRDLKRIEDQLKSLNYQENQEETLIRDRRELAKDVNRLKEKIDDMQTRNSLGFDYRDPEPNFDRSRVFGLISNLFKINDASSITALDVAAGGKLKNVVVDNEITGKKLLQNGGLKRSVTFIPLSKIKSYPITKTEIQNAKHLVGKENVCTALSLISFDQALLPAMQYVFGNILVCPDMNIAKKVAFGVNRRTVTFDGEVFDPAGTLSGGSMTNIRSTLKAVLEIQEFRAQAENKQNQLKEVDSRLNNLKEISTRYHQMKQQFDIKKNEVDLLEQKLQQNPHYIILEEIRTLEQIRADQNDILVRCRKNHEKFSKKAKDLEEKICNTSATRDQEIKNAEKEIATYKKKVESFNKQLKEKDKDVDVVKLEIEDLVKGLAALQQQMTVIDTAVATLQENYDQCNEELKLAQEKVRKSLAEVEEQKELLRSKSKEIQEVYANQEKLQAFINENELKKTNMNHEMAKETANVKECHDKLKHLVNKYDWIAEEKNYFGQPNTAYDFNATNPREAGHQLKKLEERKTKLGRNVNMGAMNMLNKAEDQYQDLMKKKRIVENDKSKIAAVIKELDEKKNEALIKAWEQVNKDFGSIFTILLPGTQAKLVPLEGKSVLDGLEVKVAFGNVWKESLNELSGGQRSLVALSLILSMLLFKPAPIYILDEVDAALDLSHTQNIGQMLRTHFKHSQFIVVSLKDGMFNNANVLFKTKFVDGMSTVSRYAQRQ